MFAALVPPPDVVEDLDVFLDVRREAAAFRWTPADHLHMTLAFLAEVPDRRLDDLVERSLSGGGEVAEMAGGDEQSAMVGHALAEATGTKKKRPKNDVSDREVVVLRYFEHLSPGEIATLTRQSKNAVEVRLHRARARLAEALRELVEEDEPR